MFTLSYYTIMKPCVTKLIRKRLTRAANQVETETIWQGVPSLGWRLH